jgi:hypothetical protein
MFAALNHSAVTEDSLDVKKLPCLMSREELPDKMRQHAKKQRWYDTRGVEGSARWGGDLLVILSVENLAV